MKKEKRQNGFTYSTAAMLCFAVLGFDGLAIALDYLIFGDVVREGFGSYTWVMKMMHSGMVIIVWSISIGLIGLWMKKKNVFKEILNTSLGKRQVLTVIAGIAISFIFKLLHQMIEPANIPQILDEYRHFENVFGNHALIISVFQNVYYIIEVALVVLLLALFQRAGELWFHTSKLPYGSVGLTFTWGLAHIFHGWESALWIMGFSLLVGLFFVLGKKNIWASYFMILCIFVV